VKYAYGHGDPHQGEGIIARPVADEPRNAHLNIRLTDAEMREVKVKVDGRNRSDLLRRLVLDWARKPE